MQFGLTILECAAYGLQYIRKQRILFELIVQALQSAAKIVILRAHKHRRAVRVSVLLEVHHLQGAMLESLTHPS